MTEIGLQLYSLSTTKTSLEMDNIFKTYIHKLSNAVCSIMDKMDINSQDEPSDYYKFMALSHLCTAKAYVLYHDKIEHIINYINLTHSYLNMAQVDVIIPLE
jgi:hypothetical protein